jgi:glyoxylase-like metal-dependent hydrolase (beta-lactamase superfamily II)
MPVEGHTAADLAVLDIETGILVAGDIVFLDRAPTTPGAVLDDWRRSLAALRALAPSATIPGHGPLDHGGVGFDQTRGYLDWLEATLRSAVGDGLDMMEAMAAPIPAGHGQLGAQPIECQRSVVHLYPWIEEELLPVVAAPLRQHGTF